MHPTTNKQIKFLCLIAGIIIGWLWYRADGGYEPLVVLLIEIAAISDMLVTDGEEQQQLTNLLAKIPGKRWLSLVLFALIIVLAIYTSYDMFSAETLPDSDAPDRFPTTANTILDTLFQIGLVITWILGMLGGWKFFVRREQ